MTNEKDLCLTCYCRDPNTEECAIPSYDKWFACPIENWNPKYQKILEEMIDELLFIEELNLRWGKKVD